MKVAKFDMFGMFSIIFFVDRGALEAASFKDLERSNNFSEIVNEFVVVAKETNARV
jgi:hypothetical protein